MRKIIYEESSDGIFIDRVVRNYEYNMPSKHSHEEYEIYFLVSGERNYFIDTKTYNIKAGTLVFINKNSVHKTSQVSSTHHDRINLEINEEPFSSFLSNTSEIMLNDFFKKYQGSLALSLKEQDYICRLLNTIALEIHNKSEGYHLYIRCKLSELLIFAKRKMDSILTQNLPVSHSSSPTFDKVSEVASYVAINYATDCSLESLAKQFYLSKSYLSRIFKSITGYTVNEYIHVQRIQNSKKLLANPKLSIKEVSNQVGYSSLTYYGRVFKRITETSPLQYRKQLIRNNPETRNKTYVAEEER